MGVGVGRGENRVIDAVKEAIGSPLLETSIDGAKAILLNIMGGYDLGMLEANEAADLIEKAASRDANIIFGASIKEELQDEIRITVIATGFDEVSEEKAEIVVEPKVQATPAQTQPVEAPVKEEPKAEKEEDGMEIPGFLRNAAKALK